jgi:hypothetical protein
MGPMALRLSLNPIKESVSLECQIIMYVFIIYNFVTSVMIF